MSLGRTVSFTVTTRLSSTRERWVAFALRRSFMASAHPLAALGASSHAARRVPRPSFQQSGDAAAIFVVFIEPHKPRT